MTRTCGVAKIRIIEKQSCVKFTLKKKIVTDPTASRFLSWIIFLSDQILPFLCVQIVWICSASDVYIKPSRSYIIWALVPYFPFTQLFRPHLTKLTLTTHNSSRFKCFLYVWRYFLLVYVSLMWNVGWISSSHIIFFYQQQPLTDWSDDGYDKNVKERERAKWYGYINTSHLVVYIDSDFTLLWVFWCGFIKTRK